MGRGGPRARGREGSGSSVGEKTQNVVYVYDRVYVSNTGVASGIIAILFAVLGLFTVGILFVPLAILFSAISFSRALGLFRGFTDISVNGLVIFLASAILIVVATGSSPTLWLLFLLGAATRHS